jgi:putative DNA primase/helicase
LTAHKSKIKLVGGEAPKLMLDPRNPIQSAREFTARNFTNVNGLRTFHHYRNDFWTWTGSYYLLTEDEVIAAKIWTLLENAFRLSEDDKIIPFKPTRAKVGEVIAALAAVCQLDNQIMSPTWLTLKDGPPADELFGCGNGLLHLPTGKLHPPSPDYFNVNASDVIYDPCAPKPTLWHAFLKQLFGDDQQSVELLQEWFGYSLSPDLTQQKILGMLGPRRSGKGTIGRILKKLLGSASVCGPTMSSLATEFGLEPLIVKSLAIVSDVRIGRRTDKTTLTERLLSISGQDGLSVPRKFKIAWHGTLPTRLMMLFNEPPTLADGSGAYAGRLLLLALKVSFYGKEDPALTDKLAEELPGILNWAIEGYRRLQERGHFVQPESSMDIIDQIEMLGSPVKSFVRYVCEVRPGLETEADRLYEYWKIWCTQEGIKDPGTKEWFGRNLRIAVPGVSIKRLRTESDSRERVYTGIGIRAEAEKAEGVTGNPM